MVVEIPEQRYFPDFLKKKVLEKTGFELPDWEIYVQRKDDIAWSVILSYLISTNLRDKNDFSRRLFTLTGCYDDLNLVKKAIKTFNPFRNRFSCFYDVALQQVVINFKKKTGWDTLSRISCKLLVISKTLGCRILHIWKDKYAFRYNTYPEKSEKSLDTIFIISRDYTNEENNFTGSMCNFLLNQEMGERLKFASLRYFLKEAEIRREILKEVVQLVESKGNFLISLLRNDYQDVISILYSSAYLVSKLEEAGFKTDPKTKVCGFSAFYYALSLGKIDILYKLYYFSANNYYQTRESYGNSESCIIHNLQQLENIFSSDLEKFETLMKLKPPFETPEYHRVKKEYKDLIRLNKFLLEINSNLLEIKSQLNCDSIEDTLFEASKRRNIMLCILDLYKTFFRSDTQESVTHSSLDDFIEFRNYYNSIDLATAIIFFSNVIYLKERLALENEKTYSQMEISFYETIYFNYFSNTTLCEEYLKQKLNSHSIIFIPLIRRLENMDNIVKFSTNLRSTIITKNNVIKHIPQREILSIFKFFPIFKNVIHLNRIKNYIDTALKIKIVDEKSVLVIQRVLQVIGEYVNPNNDRSDDDDFRRFLLLVLPKDISHVLSCIRNKLSHLQSYELKVKFDCEKDLDLFRSIKKEINLINYPFVLVYNFYVCKESLKLLKFTEQQMTQIKQLMEHSTGIQDQVISTFKETDIKRMRYDIFCLHRDSYTDLFEIVLENVLEKIAKEIEWAGNSEQIKDCVLNILWPLKRLVEVLVENDCSKLSNLSEILETLTIDGKVDLKSITDKFIAKCNDLLSELNDLNPERKIKITPLLNIKYTERFFKILKGFTFLSDEQKDEIRKEIPENVKLGTENAHKLIELVHEGFSLNIDKNTPVLQISYLSKTKRSKIFCLYESRKRDEILFELESTNPVSQLEEIFSKNSVNKKKYETLCEIMQFSKKTKELLSKLVDGQIKKVQENNLRNLLNRIQLLKKILIEENGDIHNLWLEVKRPTSKQHVVDKIIGHYLRQPSHQASVEMLLMDCMSIFEKNTGIENFWIKSSNLYCGINLRNILCHGNPFLDRLCELLAPDDLASELIQKILLLIEDEDVIQAILELYDERLNGDYSSFKKVINSPDEEEYCELKNRILKCHNWRHYVSLLPGNRTSE